MAMDFGEKRALGRTGLWAGRLGISSSYGAPREAFEEAFERGCNYFTWGTFLKGRSPAMREAIRNIIRKGKRDELIIAMVSYAHNAYLMEAFYRRGLKALGVEYADVLIMGYYPRRPSQGTIEKALKMKGRGIVRFIGLTSHNRRLFPELAREGAFDLFHVRYNAAHRGAETETFPYLEGEGRPGVVSFTATRWGMLLDPKRMPPGETPPTASDCYRFALSHPSVDVCMTGARDMEQMREALRTLEAGPMREEELERMRKIGDHLRRK
jgi:predicted aldo/keto reductase-like oxidoreductase